MKKLEFECDRNGIETANYYTLKIRVERDEYAPNPWKDWDGNPPIMVISNGAVDRYGLSKYLPTLTRAQVKNNLADIVALLEQPNLLRGLSDWACYSRCQYSDATEYVNDILQMRVDGACESEKTEIIAACYGFAGIVALTSCASGSMQGHVIDMVIVATPEWLAETGATIEKPEDLQSNADLYAAWAFGETYGYVIENAHGEELAACYGYYGEDHEKSGLADAAMSELRHLVGAAA